MFEATLKQNHDFIKVIEAIGHLVHAADIDITQYGIRIHAMVCFYDYIILHHNDRIGCLYTIGSKSGGHGGFVASSVVIQPFPLPYPYRVGYQHSISL